MQENSYLPRTSNAGPIMRQGPHQLAQKSATTSRSPDVSSTSANSSCTELQTLHQRNWYTIMILNAENAFNAFDIADSYITGMIRMIRAID